MDEQVARSKSQGTGRKSQGTSQQLLTRRKFVKWLAFVLFFPLLYLWVKVIKRNDLFSQDKELIVSNDELVEGFNILDKVIIVSNNNEVEVFSSSCTHLGCSINRVDKGELVCPCHGSRYNMNGDPVKGPSVKSLKKLRYVRKGEGDEIVVNLV